MNHVILGCGYIGTALLKHWKSCQQHVIATTRSREHQQKLAAITPEAKQLRGSDRAALQELLAEADRIVICVAPSNRESYQATYLDTASALSGVLPSCPTVTQLVYTSATSVYGCRNGNWVAEDSTLSPIGENGKVLCRTEEIYLSHLPKHIAPTVLRLGGIFGPGRELTQRARYLAGKRASGSGDTFCNLAHQEDIVRAIDWVIEHHLTGIYNICGDDHPTRRELYSPILQQMGLPAIEWDPTQVGPHSGNKRVSNQKIKDTGFCFLHRCRA
ncbi:MAG: NAD-dependent epimerase/dehydratase family protein [Chlamydiota bacterium]